MSGRLSGRICGARRRRRVSHHISLSAPFYFAAAIALINAAMVMVSLPKLDRGSRARRGTSHGGEFCRRPWPDEHGDARESKTSSWVSIMLRSSRSMRKALRLRHRAMGYLLRMSADWRPFKAPLWAALLHGP